MIEPVLSGHLTKMMADMGDVGVFIAMFLESSIVPIPSEVILLGAGAVGIPLVSILVFGALGSTLGAMAGYLLGRYAALPVILRFGKFILIKPHHIYKAEAFAKKYGVRLPAEGHLGATGEIHDRDRDIGAVRDNQLAATQFACAEHEREGIVDFLRGFGEVAKWGQLDAGGHR